MYDKSMFEPDEYRYRSYGYDYDYDYGNREPFGDNCHFGAYSFEEDLELLRLFKTIFNETEDEARESVLRYRRSKCP